jgi:hypothetical protein
MEASFSSLFKQLFKLIRIHYLYAFICVNSMVPLTCYNSFLFLFAIFKSNCQKIIPEFIYFIYGINICIFVMISIWACLIFIFWIYDTGLISLLSPILKYFMSMLIFLRVWALCFWISLNREWSFALIISRPSQWKYFMSTFGESTFIGVHSHSRILFWTLVDRLIIQRIG